MPKKLTYEFVKQAFESEGYTLLSSTYKNNHSKLKYICPNGHTHSIIWNSWKSGHRCPYCDGQAKLDISFVRDSFTASGYVLLNTEYTNNTTKLDYICPNGHKHFVSWNHWSRGVRCPYCYGNVKETIEYITRQFEMEGYTLITKAYLNNRSPLVYICPEGHTNTTIWSNWKKGHRCPTCRYIANSGSNNPNWNGGSSFEPYCEVWKDQEYKQDIRERDGNCCLNPYCNSKNPNDLTIHHINYDKKDCHPKNLITVCRSCNSKANVNRKWHKAWYQAIMYKRYNYGA